MARHGVALLGLLVLALVCGIASAASSADVNQPGPPLTGTSKGAPPNTSVSPNKPPGNPLQGTTYRIINPGRHKRTYELTCDDSETKATPCNATCPFRCPNKCLVLCPYCMTFCMCDFFPGTACGDPRFTGGDGNTFYFHGKKDQEFCIVSDTNLHINAHFIGKHNPDKSRDFTWVQALGVTFGDHRLYIGARKASEWDEDEDHIEIAFDGEPIDLEAVKNARRASKAVPTLSVTRTDTVNTVMVELDGVFRITANAVPITDEDSRIHNYGKTENDSLVHLDLGFKFHSLTKNVHGVIGQTYRSDYVNKLDVKAKMPVMGGAPKYLSSSLFSTDCAVSRFRRDGAGRVALAS